MVRVSVPVAEMLTTPNATAVPAVELLFLMVMLSPSVVAPTTAREVATTAVVVAEVPAVVAAKPILRVLAPALKVTAEAVFVVAAIVTDVMPVSNAVADKAPATSVVIMSVSIPVMVRVVGVA